MPVETYFLTQIPHPIHKNSEINAILSEGLTSIHNFPSNRLIEPEIYQIMAYPSSPQDMTG
ncbi:hypothetical protein AGABI2DRAFT_73456 [Agaricus bisporus var. bisporus H97]|uniref:hypothetical protein n=1 Tax=Agaricus bisporus var. bisporus (strain H97 / ATCC MYA-4626 / FGSC 10389) TaxID=936046 RepID=UPI00029F7EB5|nr:hypothetical protein AGABI2DRAFT_73456 [Agaricus bisporus var. bisporus H97]EKV45176.1 hypothetical protein AGABI2DRAFT_73456 [Agaricus bisporus var. bisporus H97]